MQGKENKQEVKNVVSLGEGGGEGGERLSSRLKLRKQEFRQHGCTSRYKTGHITKTKKLKVLR